MSDSILFAQEGTHGYAHWLSKGFNVLYGGGAVKFWKDSHLWVEKNSHLTYNHAVGKMILYLYWPEIRELYGKFDLGEFDIEQ